MNCKKHKEIKLSENLTNTIGYCRKCNKYFDINRGSGLW